MPLQAGFYTPPSEYVGYSPENLRYGVPSLGAQHPLAVGVYGGRPEDLAQALGIGAKTPLENRAYTIVGDFGQATEFIQGSGFKQTSPYASAEAALAASKPITEQAYAERGRQLEAEKQPLTDRYNALLDELTRRETKETGAQSTALAREYGKRGIPLSSGAYEQNLLQKTGDISQFYGLQRKDVGFEREDKLRQVNNLLADLPIERARELNLIDQKIGELKAKGASEQLVMALEMYKLQREENWRQQTLDLQKQQVQLQYGSPTASENDPLRRLFESRIGFSQTTTSSLDDLWGQFGLLNG